jgi:hypothetical protein
MKEQIEIDLDRIKQIVKEFGDEPFSTINVIEKYSGGFYSNIGTSVYHSLNAKFGKLLKRNEDNLGITQIEKDILAKDNNSHETKTSIWKKNK